MVCDRPTPDMHWDRTILQIIVAVWHGKRDPTGPDLTDHSEAGALLGVLSEEVRSVIYTFCKTI